MATFLPQTDDVRRAEGHGSPPQLQAGAPHWPAPGRPFGSEETRRVLSASSVAAPASSAKSTVARGAQGSDFPAEGKQALCSSSCLSGLGSKNKGQHVLQKSGSLVKTQTHVDP